MVVPSHLSFVTPYGGAISSVLLPHMVVPSHLSFVTPYGGARLGSFPHLQLGFNGLGGILAQIHL
jgi:hypothetical protein